MSDAPAQIRVLIADDSDPVRHALRMLLESHPRIEVVGEAKNGFEAIEFANALEPDLVLMDLRMPELDGIAASRILLAEPTDLRIVMLSAHADAVSTREAQELGVERYIYKGESSAEVIAAVLGS